MLSVIICTSPGREANLDAALACVMYQKHLPAEVIVVDDGSQQGEAVVRHHQQLHKTPIHYLWRPNDCSVARSRNLAAARARQAFLVFIDSDILLNPHALEGYRDYLQEFTQHALYGYFGYQFNYTAPSFLVPGREVFWCDRRFVRYTPEALIPSYNMLRYPHEWAWSGNFAMHRDTYWSIQGFNATFKGWGNEDLDFAWRLRQEGVPLHFFLDAWGEHQVHERTERFHTLTEEEKIVGYTSHYVEATDYTPEVRCSEMGSWRLRSAIFKHYIPQGTVKPTKEFSPELVVEDKVKEQS